MTTTNSTPNYRSDRTMDLQTNSGFEEYELSAPDIDSLVSSVIR